ncbi:solute carrier family 46 member 3 [Sceloporus undulatus]|uniref:solute carrier family 46 member 3 n=1 Tax=Sceloporus undulatus TaxID=8520 RepID=UPI001C4B9ECD|nr:solute carrier family 46 member 3 [Sceloporus undulatus]XP_042315698.1 solute carrier family 46 member 3 [Sceloporus undulatus]XP_042315699.1 solute carrier family 46 member 3 [Sceloporus undulatus]
MKKILVVEPVIFIYTLAYSLSSPLAQQYLYRRLWEESTNSTFTDGDNISHCGVNQSDPIYLKQKEIQENASLLAMKMGLSGAVPSILMAFVLVANGERCGRKISLFLPLVGNLIYNIFYSIMSSYSLPLVLLYPLTFLDGLFGSMATFLGGAFSYTVDLCKTQKQKMIRIAVVDLIFGLTSGLGGLTSGYILKGIGFTWTFAALSLLQVVNILYVSCCLGDTIQVPEYHPQSLKEGLKETFSGVYMLFKSSPCKKRISIILLLCTFMTYLFTMFGGTSLYTLYELNSPLCWNAIYIGYGSAVSTLFSLTGFLGLVLIARYLKDIYIVYSGILSYVVGTVLAAFATTTLLMFLVRVPSMLLFVPIPVLRSMLSKIVLPQEQGSIFACIACLEILTGMSAIIVFNSLYAKTVAWFPGFSFLFSGVFCIVPLSFLSCLMFTSWREEDLVQLVNEEDSLEENADS